MGNQQAQTQAIENFLEKSTKVTRLNKTESALVETNLVKSSDEGPVVVKRLFQVNSADSFQECHDFMTRVNSLFDTENKHPNVLTYHKDSPAKLEQGAKEKDKLVTVAVRQFVCFNLIERLDHSPLILQPIEKQWLIFQILCGLEQIHSEGMVHGDIKPDNILVTSYDWVMITDISQKPALLMDDDLKKYNLYFGYLENNLRAYIAPERWYSPGQSVAEQNRIAQIIQEGTLKASMDIFSAGCVLAEIMMDGTSLFSLAELAAYKRGDYDPRDFLQKNIEDPKIVDLISQMIDLDPTKRPSSTECLTKWNQEVFPLTFSKILYQLGASFQKVPSLYSDNKIALIRYHTNKIFETCFGVINAVKTNKFKEPLDPEVFRLVLEDDALERSRFLVPQFDLYEESKDAFEAQYKQSAEQDASKKQNSKNSALLIIQQLGYLYDSCFLPSSKLVALELIQKLSEYLSFDLKLGYVLPFIVKTFDTSTKRKDKQTGGSRQQSDHSSKCRVKGLEVMLSLFDDLHECTEEVIIEAFDYKVFQNYILPVIKRLMEQSKTDSMLKLAVARNLSLIAKVGIRLLEVTIGSCNKRREDQKALKRAESKRFQDDEHKKDFEEKYLNMTRLAKTTIRRGTLALGRVTTDLNTGQHNSDINNYEEDIELASPNYDAEMLSLWQEIEVFIQSFSGEKHDSSSIESMLKNLAELSLMFGVERSDFLIQQCISAINRKDYRVRIQVLKTMTSLSLRVGQKKVTEYVIPLAESLLEDPEDMVILENIKMLNQLIKLRLVTQKQSLEVLDKLTPFLYHPNRQLRVNVARYITIIATVGHHKQTSNNKVASEHKFVVDKKPLFSKVEFFCFVRPKVLPFLIDSSDPLQITNEKELIDKLKPPLTLSVMQKYFKILKSLPQQTQEQRQYFQMQCEQLPNQLCDQNDNDTTAFAFLSEIFVQKLKQMKLKGDLNEPVESLFYLQNSAGRSAKVYRVIQAQALAKLMGIDMPTANNRVPVLDQDSSILVREYLQGTNRFDTQKSIKDPQQSNYGLNDPLTSIQSGLPVHVDNLMKALNITPVNTLTKPYYQVLRQTKSKKDGVSECIGLNTDMVLPMQGAHVSLTQHFDLPEKTQTQRVPIGQKHRKEYQLVKNDNIQNHTPQGILLTTLYEHKNAVNTVAVTEDNRFFMTGSREDKEVRVWSVANIEEDVTSRSRHSFATPSSYINQIEMIHNSQNLAVAGSTGLRVIDLSRSMQMQASSNDPFQFKDKPRKNDKVENLASLVYKVDLEDPQDEVTRCVNMILPNDSGQHLIAYATANGSLYLNDLRAKTVAQKQEGIFGCQRGLVTSMVLGQDAYTLTVGTLGGYVMVYDVRYSTVSTVFRHSLNYPTLALATVKKTGGPASVLVSAGGQQHDVCQLNLETGNIDLMLKSAEASQNHIIGKSDIPMVPQYVRETAFKDNMMSTLRRESNFQMFNRSLLSVKNHIQFMRLMNQAQKSLINNIDTQLQEESKFRYMLVRDAYASPSACRTILVPRYTRQSLMFDGDTGMFAITGSNDRKLRYWNLQTPSYKSYAINTPRDEEVTYLCGKVNSANEAEETKIVQEKTLSQKEFPMMTAQRVKENVQPSVSGQGQLCIINGQNVWVKYKENSVYHNTIQSVVQEQDSSNLTKFVEKSLQRSSENGTNSQAQMTVTNFNGTSQGQHFNDLGLYANAAADNVLSQEHYRQSSELATEKIIRNSENVSHSDTILDLAIVEIKTADDGVKPLLISCSRDTTVKIWR